jgi:lipopolysaccharide/colanic/teichoic acid biosynthesis glycosyltransferase
MRLFAFILLIFLIPFFVFIYFLVFIFDGKPVVFIQERVGQGRNLFTIYKFKTMKDNKITKLGRVLRKLGIDEMLQLINIYKGQMAFVGPRPLLLSDIVRLNWNSEYYDLRWKVKPGITGMAQLSKVCSTKISWFYDKYYVTHHNFCLDLLIILKSLFIPIIGKHKIIQK